MKEYIIKIGDEPDIMGNYPLTEKAKELVRCKDCRKRRTPMCRMYFSGSRPSDTWFCKDGERKDGDGE